VVTAGTAAVPYIRQKASLFWKNAQQWYSDLLVSHIGREACGQNGNLILYLIMSEKTSGCQDLLQGTANSTRTDPERGEEAAKIFSYKLMLQCT
jgi:hypothetical protein